MKISLYVITKNEEARLPVVLDAAAPLADEIVVVDSGSTDGTEGVALRYGARFIHNDWVSVGHQAAFAERCCTCDWVLRLDADEELSPELVREIKDIKRTNPPYDGYKLRIGEVFPGQTDPIPWVRHYRLIRLYNRRAMGMSGRFDFDDVAYIKKNPRIKLLDGFVRHRSFLSVKRTVDKRNNATDLSVARAFLEKKNYSPWRMVGCMSANFFKCFILDRYFLHGFWGFIHSVNIGYMRFLKFAKFYEANQIKEQRGENIFLHPGK